MSHKISNVRFEQIKSDGESFNKVKASFLLDGKEATYLIYTKKDKNPISEAKKIFDSDIVTGKVFKTVNNIHSFKRPFIITASVLGAAVIALGGVLTYKLIQDNNNAFKEYLNNPLKITTYNDGVLFREQTFKYNKDWYQTESLTKTYSLETGLLSGITETKFEYDNKNRVIKGDNVIKDADGNMLRRSEYKNTFETDNKGTESTANYEMDNGVEHLVASTYDEYEKIYTNQGVKQINNGEDLSYNSETWKLQTRKVRQSEGIIPDFGHDSYSTASGKYFHYDESGKVESTDIMYQETERKWVSKTKENIKRLSKSKIGDQTEKIELLTGSSEINEDKNPILEDLSTYDDEAATNLKERRKNVYTYDDLKRSILNQTYMLDLSIKEKERWNLTAMTVNSYVGKFTTAAVTFSMNMETAKQVTENHVQNTFDKYGRVIASETMSAGGKKKDISSRVIEYGDPIPISPERQQRVI